MRIYECKCRDYSRVGVNCGSMIPGKVFVPQYTDGRAILQGIGGNDQSPHAYTMQAENISTISGPLLTLSLVHVISHKIKLFITTRAGT
jgi:hypothetical protein